MTRKGLKKGIVTKEAAYHRSVRVVSENENRGGNIMITKVQKRNGDIVTFDSNKIVEAIWGAVKEAGGNDKAPVYKLAEQAVSLVEEQSKGEVPHVETIQDIVETVLIKNGHDRVSKAFILYRKKRGEVREAKSILVDVEELIYEYIGAEPDKRADTGPSGNANMGFSLQGLNNYFVEAFSKRYWMNKVYGNRAERLHKNGDIHIHDMGLLAPYCMGHDFEMLLREGFKGAYGKVESKPAKHFDSALGQLVNFLYTLQGESAGANAISSFDTYMAPFIRHDQLSYREVKKSLQKFVFNMNIPTRVGFQTPFTNVTLDLNPHPNLKERNIVIGGIERDTVYGEYQEEMDMFNLAFCEVMMEGDGAGRMFSFPIPTVNITPEFDYTTPVADKLFELTAKFGTPYFSNFVNSDMKPEDARSMCCRLRLDNRELEKRGGGLFGSNPLTGSINVTTINMARIGYLAKSKQEFLARVYEMMEVGKDISEQKRKVLEQFTELGLYPYTRFYLKSIFEATGAYYTNHFSTIGLIGMNEACMNLLGVDIGNDEGKAFAVEVLNYMREVTSMYQEETGNLYNLEASPAEGATYRFARIDKSLYPDCATQGEDEVYYTNSTQLPVGYTDDLFEAVEHQQDLQELYTGGTVLHGFLGESPPNGEVVKLLVQRAFCFSTIPYLTITPTYSLCDDHGYLLGEQPICPYCSKETEVWSRVVGFHRPVKQWNRGKQEEFKDRTEFVNGTSFEQKPEIKIAG